MSHVMLRFLLLYLQVILWFRWINVQSVDESLKHLDFIFYFSFFAQVNESYESKRPKNLYLMFSEELKLE